MFGRHMNIQKNVLSTLKLGKEVLNVNCFQIFLKSPQRYSMCKIKDKEEFEKIKNYVVENEIYLVSHSTYLCNLANTKIKYFDMVIDDLNCITKMGGKGTVVHVGKSCKNDIDECTNLMCRNIKYIIDNTKNGYFILETAAGQGTEMLVKLEEMATFYHLFNEEYKKRIKFCIDTCHIFAAGYDLNKIEEIDNYFNNFDKLIGLNKIEVIHFNDSKTECGSRKDRHESLTCGKINIESLKHIYLKMNKLNIPIILETKGTIPVLDEFNIVRNFKK